MQYHLGSCKPFLSNGLIEFQTLGISESRIETDISATTNIQLPVFKIWNMSNKSANGGALYITDAINCKLTPKLNVEKERELELIFI